jgi:hypothetical protein
MSRWCRLERHQRDIDAGADASLARTLARLRAARHQYVENLRTRPRCDSCRPLPRRAPLGFLLLSALWRCGRKTVDGFTRHSDVSDPPSRRRRPDQRFLAVIRSGSEGQGRPRDTTRGGQSGAAERGERRNGASGGHNAADRAGGGTGRAADRAGGGTGAGGVRTRAGQNGRRDRPTDAGPRGAARMPQLAGGRDREIVEAADA